MKKILSMILVIVMLTAFVPSVFAEEDTKAVADVLTYDFTSYGLTGSSESASSTTATYQNTSEAGSAPWAFVVHTASTNGNTCYVQRLRFNWYNDTHPQLGERAIALKLKVPAGNYSAQFAIYADIDVPNANIYMIPTSETELCQKLSQTYGLSDGIKEIPEKYYMGFVNGYRSSGGEKKVTLKGINVAQESEYFLVVAANGVDENFTYRTNRLYEMGIRSLTLDKSEITAISVSTPVEAMNIGDEVYATAEITRGDNTYPGNENVTWVSENAHANVDSSTGKITAVSEGVARIKAVIGNVESEAFSIVIINPDKNEYVYDIYGNALNNTVDGLSSDALVKLSFSDVNTSISMPWRLAVSKKHNGYSMYAPYTSSSFTNDNITANGFTAYTLLVPKAGKYDLSVKKHTSTDSGKAKIYFAPAASLTISTTIPSETGPVKTVHYVNEIDFYGVNNTTVESSVGEVTVPVAGEYLVVILPSDISATGTYYGRYNYKGFILTPSEDKDIADAFETEEPVATVYNPSVSGAGFTIGESSETVEGITETKQADGSYKMYAPETSGDYNFLYWAKGLTLNKRIVSYENEFYYTPAGGDNNILIAVYDKADGETNKAEFYNANGQLIKLVTDTSADKTVPLLPSMAGYNNATSWKQYNGDAEVTVGQELTPSGTMIFVAQYELEEPIAVTVTVVGGEGTATVSYGERVTCTADSSKGELKWWKKTVGDTSEIVSINETYSFLAWEDCTVTAEYADIKPAYTGSTMKIVLDTFVAGDLTAVMAEFIGFGADAVEKGIMYEDGTKIAMTRPGNQFTVTGEVGNTFKGYAIVKNGDGFELIADGKVTISAGNE